MAGAVLTLRVKQNRSAGLYNAAGVFESLVGLPQIDVERVAARGDDQKIVWIFHGDAEQLVDRLAAFAMSGVVVAGDDFGQLAAGSQHNVDEEIGLDQAAGVE